MRLRVFVRRNGLPEAKIVWSISVENQPTIAKLVEQINDIFPLESEQWGLDDYAVELLDGRGESSGFECLHFQPIKAVLKEDDQVLIRPLFTDDHKRRRVSGRVQISAGGQHLIDGVPYGRSLIKLPGGRPPVSIPPPKRRRITYTGCDSEEAPEDDWDMEEDDGDYEDDEYEDEATSQKLLMASEFNESEELDAVRSSAFSDEESEDQEGDQEDTAEPRDSTRYESDHDDLESDSDDQEALDSDDDLAQEVNDLQAENKIIEGADEGSTRSVQPNGNRGMDLKTLDKISMLETVFPSAPTQICEQVLAASSLNPRDAHVRLSEAFEPSMTISQMLSRFPEVCNQPAAKSKAVVSRPGRGANKSFNAGNKAPFLPAEDADMADEDDDYQELAEEVSDFVKRYDYRGLPPGSISSGNGLQHMAALRDSFSGVNSTVVSETAPRPHGQEKAATEEDDETSSSGSDSSSEEDFEATEDSEDEETSDDDDEDDEDSESSDSGPEETSAKRKPGNHNAVDGLDELSGSSSESDSENSDSSSDSDDEPTDLQGRLERSADPQLSARSTATDSQAKLSSNADSQQSTVPPGQGKSSTRSRNARRRAAAKAKKSAGSEVIGDSQVSATSSTPAEPPKSTDPGGESFEARRKALLDAIANGGVELGPSGKATFEREGSESSGRDKRKRVDEESTAAHDQNAEATTPINGGEADESSSAQKRRRIDLGAGRRMLFGALGLRNPKTKDDEEKLRTKLMKDVRPLQNSRLDQDPASVAEDSAQPAPIDEDLDAWRSKIIYRAVECSQEGVELSEPPFPFVMRWDPQQQGNAQWKKNQRGGQSKKAQRNQAHYYQDDGYDRGKGKKGQMNEEDSEVILNYDDEEDGENPGWDAGAEDQDAETGQWGDVEDLPALPADVSSLPSLQLGEAQVGMVITWKKFCCSTATSWQPQLVDMTAVVVSVDNENTSLQVLLAQRDRHLDQNEKLYDGEGKRVYDRFEAPDVDDEEDEEAEEGGGDGSEEEQGYRTLSFTDMLEPRILQQPLDDVGVSKGTTVKDQSGQQLSENDEGPGQQASSHTQDALPQQASCSTTRIAEQSDLRHTANKPAATVSHREGSEDMANASNPSTSIQPGQGKPPPSDLSLSDLSQISSPSRQLHESASQTFSSFAGDPSNSLDMDSQQQATADAYNPSNSHFDSTEQELPNSENLDARVGDITLDSDARVDSSRVPSAIAAAPIPPGSVESGRQPDIPLAYSDMEFQITGGDSLQPRTTSSGAQAHPAQPSARASQAGVDTILSGGEVTNDRNLPSQPKFPDRSSPLRPGSIGGGVNGDTTAVLKPSSPDSLGSLDTVWCSAVTNRSQAGHRTPSKMVTVSKTQEAHDKVNKSYEKAMKELDGFEDDTDTEHIPDSFAGAAADVGASPPPASQNSNKNALSDDEIVEDSLAPRRKRASVTRASISPPPIKRRSLRARASQSSLQPESDVVDDSYSPDTRGRSPRATTRLQNKSPKVRKQTPESSQAGKGSAGVRASPRISSQNKAREASVGARKGKPRG